MGEVKQQYEVFVSYYQATGGTYADHLKKGLSNLGVNSFVDRLDVSNIVKEETDEWRLIIDKAILESKYFILLMTLGFNTRPEIIRELKYAKENKRYIIYCKDNLLPRNQINIDIDGKSIDLSKLNNVDIKDEQELLRKIGAILFHSSLNNREDYFDKRVNNLIISEGKNLKYDRNPIIEILIGSKYNIGNWLEANEENRSLVSCAPRWRNSNVTTTRDYFYGNTLKGIFYRVHVDGLFHYINNNIDSENDCHYIDSILLDVIETTLFSIRLMKKKEITDTQVLYINLLYMSGSFIFWRISLRHDEYYFHNEQNEHIYKKEFNPSDKYSKFKELFNEIFREICLDLGITQITSRDINVKLLKIIKAIDSIRTEYNPQGLCTINIKDFEFTDEEIKLEKYMHY
jgi:hypothetical protein